MRVRCPECPNMMDVRRREPRALPITGGVCPECAPTAKRLEQRAIERDRAIATFGQGRC